MPAYSKQTKSVVDSVFIDIAVVSSEYDETTEIAGYVNSLLQRKKGIFEGVDIADIRLSDSDEDANEAAYMQRLEYEVQINIT